MPDVEQRLPSLLDSVLDLWNAGMGLDCATCCLDGSVTTLQNHFCNKDLFRVACGKNFFLMV